MLNSEDFRSFPLTILRLFDSAYKNTTETYTLARILMEETRRNVFLKFQVADDLALLAVVQCKLRTREKRE